MGEYLSKPDKTKHSSEGENKWLRYGASSMQSWRRSNEDSHITALDVGNEISVFGVFDGHGGVEVARYVEYHLVDILQKNAFFKKGEYKKALE
jgi:protein phosphatase 1G